jgi:hypothetical protein
MTQQELVQKIVYLIFNQEVTLDDPEQTIEEIMERIED